MFCASVQILSTEVVEMKDAIWQAFRETGDPLYYMLYKAVTSPPEQTDHPKSA